MSFSLPSLRPLRTACSRRLARDDGAVALRRAGGHAFTAAMAFSAATDRVTP